MGETLVGSCRTVEIPVVNKSPCPVSFSISVQQILLDDEHHSDSAAQPSGISLCDTVQVHLHSVLFDSTSETESVSL